mmetsp:Transcript_9639/g.28186  ORF Transcript_9639/g.28186 Transcript_9639/m.28186 type:complete len:412 (+) Transcript_9639:367-1602(+)
MVQQSQVPQLLQRDRALRRGGQGRGLLRGRGLHPRLRGIGGVRVDAAKGLPRIQRHQGLDGDHDRGPDGGCQVHCAQRHHLLPRPPRGAARLPRGAAVLLPRRDLLRALPERAEGVRRQAHDGDRLFRHLGARAPGRHQACDRVCHRIRAEGLRRRQDDRARARRAHRLLVQHDDHARLPPCVVLGGCAPLLPVLLLREPRSRSCWPGARLPVRRRWHLHQPQDDQGHGRGRMQGPHGAHQDGLRRRRVQRDERAGHLQRQLLPQPQQPGGTLFPLPPLRGRQEGSGVHALQKQPGLPPPRTRLRHPFRAHLHGRVRDGDGPAAHGAQGLRGHQEAARGERLRQRCEQEAGVEALQLAALQQNAEAPGGCWDRGRRATAGRSTARGRQPRGGTCLRVSLTGCARASRPHPR